MRKLPISNWVIYYVMILLFAAVTFTLWAVLEHEHDEEPHNHWGEKICIMGHGVFDSMEAPMGLLTCGEIGPDVRRGQGSPL